MVNKIKVSIVEDCYLERISLRQGITGSENFTVLSCYSCAEDFIQEIELKKPDIVLMDLGLNGMNGILATQKIRQKYPEIKVIILTEHTGKDFFKASIFAGARGFVVKKGKNEDLIKIMQAVYFGAYWFDPLVANAYREHLPKPDANDLWHLYNDKPATYDLTEREMQVLKLLAQGKSNTEIAKEIIVSANTAKAHVGNILNKMKAKDRVQAAVLAVQSHLI